MRVQAKLLRFLQEREYSRMGELALRRADIRLLTASNTSLADRVASGQLREDLMYRLNTSALVLPPLRERGHDVILLARHFLRAWAAVESRPVPTLSREAAQALGRFGWPGNVRELASEMRRLVVFATGDSVRAEDLAAHIARARGEETCSLKDAVQRFERGHIREALARHGQNRTHTARALGITRQALLGKIQGLGL
jgi:two-component system response regulator AtoC